MYEGIALIVATAAVCLAAAATGMYVLLRRQEREHGTRLRYEAGRLHAESAARRDAEARLGVKDELYRILFANTTDMVFMFAIGDNHLPQAFSEVNDVACRKLGHPRERLLDMTLMDIVQADTHARLAGYSRTELVTLTDAQLLDRKAAITERPARLLMERVLEEGHVQFSRVLVSHDGHTIPADINAHRFTLNHQPVVFLTAADVSERRRAEQALRESEKRFQDFFSNSPVGVALFDARRELVNVNQACLKMFGAPDVEQFRRFDLLANPLLLPDETRRMVERGDTVSCEIPVDFTAMRSSGRYLTSRRGQAHLHLLINNLGHDARYHHRGTLVQVQDVTKRVHAEEALRHSELQLQQAQKMEALGTLAGGIAHDFNNILTPILGYTEMMLHFMKPGEANREFLEEIQKASYRARDLIKQILTFSRQGEEEHKPIHAVPIIKEVLKLQRAGLPDAIDVNCIVRTDRDVVLANPTQLHQVIMNLCTNAAYVLRPSGGLLEVTVTDITVGTRTHTDFPNLEAGPYLQITVHDTGPGIEEDTLARIFEPFFTTKPRGEGTGMGLAVVHGIVTSLKGVIRADSALGEGTTFIILLPLQDQPAAESEGDHAALPGGAGRRILFVDDEPAITRMAAEMLRALGYEATISCNSREALELVRDQPGAFDLLITDLAMPGLTGPELVAEIHALRPELPALLCTGYSKRYSADQATDDGFLDILKKPIIMRQMADMVADALGQVPA